jgi:hypothetical protein
MIDCVIILCLCSINNCRMIYMTNKKFYIGESDNNNKNQNPNSDGYPYQTSLWKNIEASHNCYAYALDSHQDKKIYFPQPGLYGIPNFSDGHGSDKEFTCSTYHQRVLMDNPHIYPVRHNKKCRKGYFKGTLVISPNEDYHWYRKNDDGTYSHKPGATKVRKYDSEHKIIQDPVHANRFISLKNRQHELDYRVVCNSYCFPKDDVYCE